MSHLTANHMFDMVNHMKTTLNINEIIMKKLKREAALRKKTMSELVESALRKLLTEDNSDAELPPLPVFRSGGARVNVANREILYEVMER